MTKLPGIPSFTGGLVGYLGYETIAWVEDIPTHESDSARPWSAWAKTVRQVHWHLTQFAEAYHVLPEKGALLK